MTTFDASFFVSNRLRLANIAASDLIVITAHGQLQRSGDCAYPFRQDSNFWYLTGLELADVTLVIDVVAGDEWLILAEKSEYELLFDSQLESNQIKDISGIQTVLDNQSGWSRLKQALAKNNRVATITAPPEYLDVYSIYTNPTRRRLCEKLEAAGAELTDLREQFASLRVIKQRPEIEAIRTVVTVTCNVLADIEKRFKDFKNERDIDIELGSGYRIGGAKGHGFDPIVASGANACVLHYHENAAALKTGDLVVIDTGAELHNYSADITRTYPVGKVSARHRAIYDSVYEAQQIGMALMKPGVTFKEVDDAMGYSLEASMRKLGLQAQGEQALLRSYYPHTSHYLGLDLHDVGDRSLVMQPGMVWTLEPGIYISAEGIGVRLEDDILITKNGHENLSDQLASSPQEIFGS